MGLLQEFKTFALKGNVVDMAVGVIIGGAFGKIVTSLVNDIIMPPIGVLTGGVDFKDLSVTIQEAVPEVLNEAGEVIEPAVVEVVWKYGAFIQQVIDFLIIALCVFIFIRVLTKSAEKAKALLAKKKEEEAPAPAPEEPKETAEDILAEIRDLMKKDK